MSITFAPWTAYPWKNELKLQAERVLVHFAEAIDQNFQGEHSPMDMLERAITLAGFSMRRMIEKRLVTDALVGRTIEILSFPARADGFRLPYHGYSGGDAYSNYHFDKPELLRLQARSLADEIVHSSQLMVISDDHDVADGILIASDWHLKKRLLYLTPDGFMKHVLMLLDDHVSLASDSRDSKSGKITTRRN